MAIDVDLLARVSAAMPGYELIRPLELKPALLALDGISRVSVEAHYELYRGDVAKRNELLGRRSAQPTPQARASRSSSRSRSAGIEPRGLLRAPGRRGRGHHGAFADLIERDFGSAEAWQADLKATGMAGRGWAWTAYDWDEAASSTSSGDAQNTYPIWNATPLVALDVHEHAYVLGLPDRPSRLHRRLLLNLDWDVVDGWLAAYRIPGPPVAVDGLRVSALDPGGSAPSWAYRAICSTVLNGAASPPAVSIQAPFDHSRVSGGASSAMPASSRAFSSTGRADVAARSPRTGSCCSRGRRRTDRCRRERPSRRARGRRARRPRAARTRPPSRRPRSSG